MIPRLDEVCRRALALPCSPSLLPRLTALLHQPQADIEELTALIRLDPVLASATLRMANSAFFAGGDPVDSISHAVMRLGMREIYRLAALSLASRWMAIEVDGYRWEAGDFCRASLLKAVAAEALAESTHLVEPSLAYTCGLVHEIGKLAVAFTCAEHFPAIRRHRESTGGPWLAAETAVLGFNHADVSARLLEEWRFPTAVITVARHNPPGPDLPEPHRPLAALIHAAHYAANVIGAGQGEDAFLFCLDAELLETHGLHAELLDRILPQILDQATHLLRDKLITGGIRF